MSLVRLMLGILGSAGAALVVALILVQLLLMTVGGLNNLLPPLWAVVGAVCGLVAGLVGAAVAPARWGVVVVGGWFLWSLTGVLASVMVPPVSGTLALPGALLAALAGGWVASKAHWAPSGTVWAGSLGSLGGFGMLTLGVATIGWAARAGLRPTGDVSVEYYFNVYLRWMSAALWGVVVFSAALSILIPAMTQGHLRRPSVSGAIGGFVGLVVVTMLAGVRLFDFYVACIVGTPLPPFSWLTGGASC